jgi:hypothetical protein
MRNKEAAELWENIKKICNSYSYEFGSDYAKSEYKRKAREYAEQIVGFAEAEGIRMIKSLAANLNSMASLHYNPLSPGKSFVTETEEANERIRESKNQIRDVESNIRYIKGKIEYERSIDYRRSSLPLRTFKKKIREEEAKEAGIIQDIINDHKRILDAKADKMFNKAESEQIREYAGGLDDGRVFGNQRFQLEILTKSHNPIKKDRYFLAAATSATRQEAINSVMSMYTQMSKCSTQIGGIQTPNELWLGVNRQAEEAREKRLEDYTEKSAPWNFGRAYYNNGRFVFHYPIASIKELKKDYGDFVFNRLGTFETNGDRIEGCLFKLQEGKLQDRKKGMTFQFDEFDPELLKDYLKKREDIPELCEQYAANASPADNTILQAISNYSSSPRSQKKIRNWENANAGKTRYLSFYNPESDEFLAVNSLNGGYEIRHAIAVSDRNYKKIEDKIPVPQIPVFIEIESERGAEDREPGLDEIVAGISSERISVNNLDISAAL